MRFSKGSISSSCCACVTSPSKDEPGVQGDNLIDPNDLNELDRRILKESFRQARKIQTRLKLDYQVH
jgi:signal-transduction protein with cAMP-binding, CBS, and nucleotidyltransferase domain